MKLKKFNISDDVLVKLTDKGRRIYFDYWKKYQKYNPSLYITPISEDKDGFSKWQLWDLMRIFGEHIYLGGENCFETNIYIDEKYLQLVN